MALPLGGLRKGAKLMMRPLSCLVLAAALAVAPAVFATSSAFAKSAKYSTKVCKHKTSSGKLKTWRCRSDQPCCSAEWLDYYTCGSKTLGCL
jgi:hypothetical protein